MFRERIIKMLGGESKRSITTEAIWSEMTASLGNASGQRVTPTTAMAISAYFASIRAISEDVAKLPIRMFEPQPDGNLKAITKHPALRVINVAPNPVMTPLIFWQTILGHKLGFQGGFAEIVRNNLGEVVALWPIDPTTVRPIFNKATNQLNYEVRMGTGQVIMMPPDRIFHIRGLGFDGITQYVISVIGQTSLGRAMAAQEFGAAHFGNGATLRGVLEAPPTLTPEGMELLQKSFKERNAGSINAYKTPILPEGVKYTTIETDPQKSQMIQTSEFTVEDVARWFRIAPNKIQHLLRSNFSNIEEENKNYALDTLMAHSVSINQELKMKLLLGTKDEGLIFKHDFTDLLEVDVEKRTSILVKEFGMGMWNTNELLEKRSMKGIGPDGEKRYIMSGMQPLVPNEESGSDDPASDDNPEDGGANPDPAMTGDIDDNDPQQTNFRISAREAKAIESQFSGYFKRFLSVQLDKMNRAEKSNGKNHAEFWDGFKVSHEQHVIDSLRSPYEILLARNGQDALASVGVSLAMAAEFIDKSYDWTKMPESERLTVDVFADKLGVRALELFHLERVKP